MKRLLFIMFLLLTALYLGLMSLAEAEAEEYSEPPLEWLWGWKVEEVPGMVTIYWDANGDGRPEFVTAHHQVSVGNVDECPSPTRLEDQILLGHDCLEGGAPMVYVVERQIRAVRWANDKWLWAIGRTWE